VREGMILCPEVLASQAAAHAGSWPTAFVAGVVRLACGSWSLGVHSYAYGCL